jgi:hypothetical protein
MIERLLVTQDDGIFNIIEPVTKQVLASSVVYEFACDWALGFINALNFIATGVRTDIRCDHQVAFFIGQMAAQNSWEEYTRKERVVSGSVNQSSECPK